MSVVWHFFLITIVDLLSRVPRHRYKAVSQNETTHIRLRWAAFYATDLTTARRVSTHTRYPLNAITLSATPVINRNECMYVLSIIGAMLSNAFASYLDQKFFSHCALLIDLFVFWFIIRPLKINLINHWVPCMWKKFNSFHVKIF